MGFCDLGTGIGNGRASVQTFNFRKRSDLNFFVVLELGFSLFFDQKQILLYQRRLIYAFSNLA